MFRIMSQDSSYARIVLTPKNSIWCLKMAPKGFKLQFYKLGPAIKMTLHANSSNFFHFESINIDDT